MRAKLTTRYIATLKPEEKPYQVHCTLCRGFIFRMQTNGTGLYYFMYRAPDGRRHKVAIGRDGEITFADAKARAEELRGQVARGIDPVADAERLERERLEDIARAERDGLTLGGFIDGRYNDWAVVNLKSHVQTLKRLRYGFIPLLDKRLVDLTPFDFEANRIRRLKGKDGKAPKPATVNRDQMTLRAALTKAAEWGMMPSNPLDKVKRAKEDRNAAIRAITAEEETAILASLEATEAKRPPDWYFKTFFIVALDTGLRRGELITLEWDDLDLEGGTLTVKGSGAKSSQSRRVPLTDRAKDTLTEWARRCPEGDKVFPRATDDGARWLWEEARKDAGVTGLRFHDLRHSYASRLAHAGVGVLLIKELLGHSSIATSQRYMHAVESDARRAVDLLQQSNVVRLAEVKKQEANG